MRMQPADAAGAVDEPAVGHEPGAGQAGKEQRVEPQGETPGHAGDDAGAGQRAQVQPAHDRGCELRHRGEGEQADRGQRLRAGAEPVVGIGHRRQRHDGEAADPQHQAAEVAAFAQAQRAHPGQRRQHQFVADHRRQRHAGHDHHAGGGGEAADVGQQGQGLVAAAGRQPQHEAVRMDGGRRGAAQSRQRDRQHQQGEGGQVQRERVARAPHVAQVLAFDHADLELAREADDRGGGEQGLGGEGGEEGVAGGGGQGGRICEG